MRLILTLLLIAAISVLAAAEPQPQQVDPRKPADAVVIIDQLTRQLQLPRDQAVALTMAIETLRAAVAPQPEHATPATPPAGPVKKD
jgi:hypothetical protein